MLAVAVGHIYLARLVVGRYSISVQGNEVQGVSRLNSQSMHLELINALLPRSIHSEWYLSSGRCTKDQ